MNLEQQVVSLELAKQLKELGVKQDSLFYWWATDLEEDGLAWWDLFPQGKTPHRGSGFRSRNEGYEPVSAFTVSELGEMLPRTINYNGHDLVMSHTLDDYEHHGFLYRTHYTKGSVGVSGGGYKTEADARAKMLIWLIENNYLSVES